MLCLLICGMRGGACREESGGGAGWGIVEGAIGCLSVVVVGVRVRLSKPPWLFVLWAPVAIRRGGHPWPFVVVGTCGRSSIVVMGPRSSIVVVGSCSYSSIMVVGSRSRSSILVAGICRWWGWALVAACRSLWWAPWTLVGARRRPSIMVVGSRSPSEVVGGHHRRASMVVLGTRGRWWAVVAVSRSSWWVLVANVDGGGGCEKRAVVTCDIAFVTSPNWDVSNCPNVSLLPLFCNTVSPFSFWGVCRCWYILLITLPLPPAII